MSEYGTVIDRLLTLDAEALARVWADLNRWVWPRDLPGLKPLWWDELHHLPPQVLTGRQYGVAHVLMAFVESRVTDAQIGTAWDEATGSKAGTATLKTRTPHDSAVPSPATTETP